MMTTRPSRLCTPIALSLLLLSAALGPAWADTAEIHEGYRGFALPIDAEQVMYVKAGDRIDVMVTFDALMKGDVKEKVTATLLQNVVVLDMKKYGDGDARFVLLLQLNPKEAQYLALSLDGGRKVRVVHRRKGDVKMKPLEMASFRKLFR